MELFPNTFSSSDDFPGVFLIPTRHSKDLQERGRKRSGCYRLFGVTDTCDNVILRINIGTLGFRWKRELKKISVLNTG